MSALVDVALGIQAVLVLGLLRAVWSLAQRVARLEGMEADRELRPRDPTRRRRL